MRTAQLGHRDTAFSLPQDRPSRQTALQTVGRQVNACIHRQAHAGQRMIGASAYLLVFIRNLLVHPAEKILLVQPPTFGGITKCVRLHRKVLQHGSKALDNWLSQPN